MRGKNGLNVSNKQSNNISCFQMTSFGVKRDVNKPGYFKVQGQVYHSIGSLLPLPAEQPTFLEIYFMVDSPAQALQRQSNIPGARLEIIHPMQDFLCNTNDLVKSFKFALEKTPAEEFDVVINADKFPFGEHARRYNAPVAQEVAAVVTGLEHGKRDIVVHKRDNRLQRISQTNRAYDGLQYPLLYTRGEGGYHWQIQRRGEQKRFLLWISTHITSCKERTPSTTFFAQGTSSINSWLTCTQRLKVSVWLSSKPT